MPPPADDPPPPEPAERLVKRLEPFKVLLAVAVALFSIGVAFATWERDVAKHKDVEELRSQTAAHVGIVQANVSTQLGSLSTQVQDLRARQSAVEAQLDILERMSQRLLDQTLEIARATGARQVPPPKPLP
jgi:hypothetical protein